MNLGAMSILLTGLLMERSATATTNGQVELVATTKSVAESRNIAMHRKRLNKDLVHDYESNQVPMNSNGSGVNVTIYMWPYDILYVNEARGSIKISGWIDMRWIDPFLQWNESEYGGIKHTHLPSERVWLPSVDLFYSKEDIKVEQKCPSCPVRVDNKGNVLQGYYFSYSFPCAIHVKYFPFDEQNCTLELANWHLDDSMMDLYAEGTSYLNGIVAVDLSIFLPNEEWDLITMNVTRKREFYNYGFFPILSYTMEIKRKSGYYVQNLVIPTLILTITALLGYHMPSTGTGVHQEKVGFDVKGKVKMGLTTILSIFILQLGVSDKLPRSSEVIPLIFVFYSGMVGLLSFAIISTSLVILVEKQGIYGQPVPKWARRFVPGLKELDELAENRGQKENGSNSISQFEVNNMDSWSRSNRNVHKHCRMLDCGCRLKHPGPRPGYILLSPENSPQVNRFIPIENGNVHMSPTKQQTTGGGGYQQTTTNNNHTTNHHYSASSPTALSIAILDALNNLRMVGEDLRSESVRRQYKNGITSEWRRAADVLEYISLMLFLAACTLFTVLFAYHSWY